MGRVTCEAAVPGSLGEMERGRIAEVVTAPGWVTHKDVISSCSGEPVRTEVVVLGSVSKLVTSEVISDIPGETVRVGMGELVCVPADVPKVEVTSGGEGDGLVILAGVPEVGTSEATMPGTPDEVLAAGLDSAPGGVETRELVSNPGWAPCECVASCRPERAVGVEDIPASVPERVSRDISNPEAEVETAELASILGLVAVKGVLLGSVWRKSGAMLGIVGLVSVGRSMTGEAVVSGSPGKRDRVGTAELEAAP